MEIGDVTAIAERRPVVIRHMDYTDDGVYQIKWPEGHTTVTVLQNPKFSVLMEFCVEAVCDEYYREGLLDAMSALDAYMDFHIEVMLKAQEIGKEPREDLLKLVSTSDQRRIGCFLACETMGGHKPEYLPSKVVTMRNNVVHKGYIPTPQEVLEQIKDILNYIIPRYKRLEANFQKQISAIFFEKISRLPPPTTPLHSHGTCAWRTIVDELAFQQKGDASTLENYIQKLRVRKAKGKI